MHSLVVLGSCFSSIVASYLKAEYNWQMLANSSVQRSDHFLDCIIKKQKRLPPKNQILEKILWKAGMGLAGLRLLDEVYPESTGRIDMPENAPGLFNVLENRTVDVFLLDNLHDLSHVLTHYRAGPGEVGYSLPLSLSRCENENELTSCYYYGQPLTPNESIENWLGITRYVQSRQPQARIFFLCASAAGSEDVPERYTAGISFAEHFPARASSLGVTVLPPLKVGAKLLLDRDHFVASMYRAMAGHIFAATEGGWIAPVGQQSPLPSVTPQDSVLPNPYATRPNHAFWRRSVTGRSPNGVDPVTSVPFRISRTDRVATAGSCFAQHVSRTLVHDGFRYLITEEKPATAAAADENFGVFPARFGNIYTPRQLLQLFDRAYGLFVPVDIAWRSADGRFLDPFRPRIQKDGYASPTDLREDRAAHLAAVRRMFEEAEFFVFTLGLTEGWLSVVDGAVFPLAPGVVGAVGDPSAYSFQNFTVSSMIDDLYQLIDKARVLNKNLKFILTVSPIPLIATYEDRHVLVATTYSKSALRVVADSVCKGRVNVSYFPAYEMITGSHVRSQFFADDLREVTSEGVAYVMSVFREHYFGAEGGQASIGGGKPAALQGGNEREIAENARLRKLIATVCDEIAIEGDMPRVASPDEAISWLKAGEAYRDAGLLDRAEQVFSQALDLFPEEMWIAHGRTVVAQRRADWTEALRRASGVCSKFPDHPIGYTLKGECLRGMGRLDEAEAAYAEAASRFPQDEWVLRGLAMIASDRHSWSEAVERWRAVLQLYPDLVPASIRLAEALVEVNRQAEAEPILAEILQREPDNAEARRLRSVLADRRSPQKTVMQAIRERGIDRELQG